MGSDPCGVRAGGDQGRQAGLLREAARDDGSGLLGILDAETAFGRRLVQVGFMRRFDPQYRAMKETIASGAIGAPLIFQSGHRNASVPAHYTGEMALTDTAVHDIDIARFLLDDEPAAITVHAPRRNSRAGDVADPLITLDRHALRRAGRDRDLGPCRLRLRHPRRGDRRERRVTLAERNEVVVRSDGVFTGRVPADWRERFVPPSTPSSAPASPPRTTAARRPERVGRLCRDRHVARRRQGDQVRESEPIKLRDRPTLYAT